MGRLRARLRPALFVGVKTDLMFFAGGKNPEAGGVQGGCRVVGHRDHRAFEHVGMAQIPDQRLEQLAETVGARKVTPAAVRVVDVPEPDGTLRL